MESATQRESGKVRLSMPPLLADTLGMPETCDVLLSGPESGDIKTLRDLLGRLSTKYRHFHYLYDADTRTLSGKAGIFLNGRDSELVDGLETRLADGDTLTFVWVIAGG